VWSGRRESRRRYASRSLAAPITRSARTKRDKTTMKINKAYVAKWCITEMEQWDKDYIDMVVPGHLMIAGGDVRAEIASNRQRGRAMLSC
jgi:hypothetical protein